MKRKLLIGAVIVVIVAGGVWYLARPQNTPASRFQLSKITRGNIEQTVSATGTLSAVGTVEIGTQVSGTVAEVYADFNDKVRKGQLLAVLDTALLKAATIDAEANLTRSQAQLEEAESDHERSVPLREKSLISKLSLLNP